MKHNKYKLASILYLLCFSMMVKSNNASKKPVRLSYNSTCGLNSKAAELANLIIEHPEQQRKSLTCHPILALTAAKKAKAMAINQRIEHYLDLHAPNELLEKNGYLLPAEFLSTSNQVESIAGGKKTALTTLNGLLNSKGHRSHILGLNAVSLLQIHIGVGYFYHPETPHEHHWVVHIAQPRNTKTDN